MTDHDRKRRNGYFQDTIEEEPPPDPPTFDEINLQEDASFEAQQAGWTASGVCTVAIVDDATAPEGGKVLKITCTGAGNPFAQNLVHPIIPGGVGQWLTVYAKVKWVAGVTPKQGRINVVCRDAGGATVQTFVGTAFTYTNGWVRIQQNDNQIPVGTVNVVLRFVVTGSVAADAVEVDEIMAVYGPNIVDAGPHPPYVPHAA